VAPFQRNQIGVNISHTTLCHNATAGYSAEQLTPPKNQIQPQRSVEGHMRRANHTRHRVSSAALNLDVPWSTRNSSLGGCDQPVSENEILPWQVHKA
ncbi:hypothetical protein N7G274_006375, partial [Stereocaulon virgatum]